MSAFDPNPTLTAAFCCSAQGCHAPANKDLSAACALRRLLSAGVLGPLLLGGFLSRLGTGGDLQHCRILTFVKMGQKNLLAVRHFKDIVMNIRLVLVPLPEDSGREPALDALAFVRGPAKLNRLVKGKF